LGERLDRTQEVSGSNPLCSTTPPQDNESVPCPLCGGSERHAVLRAPDRLAARSLGVPAGEPSPCFFVARCASCGLAFTDPRPSRTAIGRYYPDAYHGAGETSRWAALEARYRARQHREAVGWLSRRRPRRGLLLDVGCGAGDLLCALRDDGWRVRGLEPGAAAVATARARGLVVERGRFDVFDQRRDEAPEAGCDSVRYDAAYDSVRYDAVVFSGVLEHLHEPLAALQRARSLLAPGGLVAVLYVPLFDSLEARLFGARWLALDLPRHLTHFERSTFARMAATAGLVVDSTEPYSRRHSAATLVSSLAPSLQKHRFYLDEGRRPATQAARKALWLAGVTAARPAARLAAATGHGSHCSFFLSARPG
jgi:SAM-dependent methyltransferase